MDDITKCTGEGCLLKLDCHRWTRIEPYKDEQYFVEVPFNHKLETCEYIWNDNAEELWKGIERLTKPTN